MKQIVTDYMVKCLHKIPSVHKVFCLLEQSNTYFAIYFNMGVLRVLQNGITGDIQLPASFGGLTELGSEGAIR